MILDIFGKNLLMVHLSNTISGNEHLMCAASTLGCWRLSVASLDEGAMLRKMEECLLNMQQSWSHLTNIDT